MPNNIKLSTPQWIVGIASALGFVFTFFTWFTWDCSGLSCGYLSDIGYNGFYSWGYLYFLATLVALVLIVLRVFLAASVKLPALPVKDWELYTGAGAAMVVFALLDYITKPGGQTYLGLTLGGYSAGFGWFAALIMAIGVAVGGWMSKADPQPVTSPLNIGSPGGMSPPPPPTAPPPPGA